MNESVQVEHNLQKQCFSVLIDGYQGLLEYRTVDEQTLDFHHTFVPDELRGKGIASILAKAAFSYAKDHQLKVIPSCSYIATYMQRHPQ